MCVTNVQGTAGSCCQEPLLLESPGALSVPPLLVCDVCCGLPGKHVGNSILRLFTGALVIIYHRDTLSYVLPNFTLLERRLVTQALLSSSDLGFVYLWTVRAFGALSTL